MFSSRYVYIYTIVLALAASVSLALVVTVFKPIHSENEAASKKKDILSSIASEFEVNPALMSNSDVIKLFEEKVKQVVVDANGKVVEGVKAEDVDMAAEEKKPLGDRKYPLFIYEGKNGKIYLASVRGSGLWDKIWGTIAIKEDLNTVVGASFGHQAETPGLGAEIKDNPAFPAAFVGKTLFENGEFVSIKVLKGASDPKHHVDAISGATITSVGVSNMMQEGLRAYVPYFNSISKKG